MMASTFPTSRTNSNNIKDGLKEIQSKKENLLALESALKKRVRELRELCLKEGELTGHLPIDYPLQPREPIPQIRRRNDGTTSTTTSSIAPPLNRNQLINRNHQFLGQASSSNPNLATSSSFPSRPMSTHSTSSSISTASSQTRSNILPSSSYSSNNNHNNNNNNGHCFNQIPYNNNNTTELKDRNQATRYEQMHQPHHHQQLFKRPFNAPIVSTFDSDSLGHVRASSTASSSSSSGSATSSTLSAPSALSNVKMPPLPDGSFMSHQQQQNSLNLHGRSCSESITNNNQHYLSNRIRTGSQNIMQMQTMMKNGHQLMANSNHAFNHPGGPMRPPRGLTHSQSLSSNDYNQLELVRNKTELGRQTNENRTNFSDDNHQQDQKALDVSSVKPLMQHFETNGSFQPYIEEETKPFQMSDYLKYSSKYRQKVSDSQKTTRQLQEENARSKLLQTNKLNLGDDKIEASMRKIERSGQKLLEATAKAIAGNPGLAEKINHILPSNNDKFLHHHSEKVNE